MWTGRKRLESLPSDRQHGRSCQTEIDKNGILFNVIIIIIIVIIIIIIIIFFLKTIFASNGFSLKWFCKKYNKSTKKYIALSLCAIAIAFS